MFFVVNTTIKSSISCIIFVDTELFTSNKENTNMTDTIASSIDAYLLYCKTQKRLDEKTIKAYQIDLNQFSAFFQASNITSITVSDLESFIAHLNLSYKPKTVRRKIASVKAFFQHLEYKKIINLNPFNKMRISFREPLLLPKTIPMHTLERLLCIFRKNSMTVPEGRHAIPLLTARSAAI